MSPSLNLAPGSKPNARRVKEREPQPFAVEEPVGPLNATPSNLVGDNRSILVVDDNLVVLQAFELKLKSSGFAVTTSASAVAVARTVEQVRAELIILDLNFPTEGGMQWTGFTVIQWLRRFPEFERVPVIVVSGADPARHKEKALAAGAVAFFQKPVTYSELLAAILQALPARKV
jgi:CheY-like chemotaxis protein